MADRGLKGTGKAAPPPLPAAVKGTGRGKAAPPPLPAEGTGRGKAAAPPLPVDVKGTGKGKGASALEMPLRVPVPGHLAAPAGTPIRQRHLSELDKSEGTFWEGLHPWGEDLSSSGVLQGLALDAEVLEEIWASPFTQQQERPHRRQAAGTVSLLSLGLQHAIETVARAKKLTPERVSYALSEDLNSLSSEQAETLGEIAQYVREASGFLNIQDLRDQVARNGVEVLSGAEKMLWAIVSVPDGPLLAQLLGERVKVSEAQEWLDKRVAEVEALVETLRCSSPFKTLLQAVLLVRNCFMQRDHAGFPHSSLLQLSTERFRGHSSTLQVVVKVLEQTHERRCNLREFQCLVIQRYIPCNLARHIIAEFLDDPESPWDVLPLLRKCRYNLCGSEVLLDIQWQVHRFAPSFQMATAAQRRLSERRSNDLVARQLGDFLNDLQNFLMVAEANVDRMRGAMRSLCSLAGVPRSNLRDDARMSDEAADILRTYRHLGERLEVELSALRKQRAARRTQARMEAALHSGAGAPRQQARCWSAVDTRVQILQLTQDPALIRELRADILPAGRLRRQAAAKRQPRKKEEDTSKRMLDMVHPGPEGSYGRCPETGRWINMLQP